jgi:hypothetical protein
MAARKVAKRKAAKSKAAKSKGAKSKVAKSKTVKKKTKVAKKKVTSRAKRTAQWPAAQLRDYRAIQGRAATLSKSLTDADFDAKGNPVKADWSRLLGDLDAWAAKYKVKLSTQEHSHAGAGGTDPVPRSLGGGCPGSFETKPVYHTTLPNGDVLMEQTSCTLKRKTLLGRCVYSCTTGVFTQ